MVTDIFIRPATPADSRRLLEIYAPYVLHTAITFEYEVPSVAEFQNRITHTLEHYPYLVAVIGDTIVGYAYASAFKSRAAYDWSVETSIYIDEAFHQKGIGTALYARLEDLLKKQNVCNVCACIAYPNPGSVSFHEALGYTTVAHFHSSGYKFDTWYDMIWMEKQIHEHSVPPQPFIPYNEIA